jgi:hypothetical protein
MGMVKGGGGRLSGRKMFNNQCPMFNVQAAPYQLLAYGFRLRTYDFRLPASDRLKAPGYRFLRVFI